jgi:glutamine synthetase
MAGLLRHAPEMMLLTNQWVNSYKRLVPGFEAPLHTSWSYKNNADLVRVPQHKPEMGMAARVEYRVPDSACNPYLAFAAVLAAGMRGIAEGYELPMPAERPVLEMSEAERAALNIVPLPNSLGEAIDRFESSTLMRETLGDTLCDALVTNKRHEWRQYRAQVTPFEIDRYLPLL